MKSLRPDSFSSYSELSESFRYFDFDSIEIKPSIDVLKFSVRFKHLSSSKVIPFLLDKGFEIEFTRKGNGFETIQSKKLVGGQWLGIFCRINFRKYRTTFEIKNPTKEHFDYLYGFLSFPEYSLSEAEYSLDFHGCDNGEMFAFLASHASLKKPGKLFTVDDYDNLPTQYLNNIRKNNQVGCKIYIKEKEALVFVRLEVSIKNRQFKVLDMETVYAATQVTAEEVFRKLEIESFDFERFLKNLGLDAYGYHEFEQDFMGAMHGYANCGGLPAVKKLISSMKKHPYNYYEKHPFHYKFFNAIKGMKFV